MYNVITVNKGNKKEVLKIKKLIDLLLIILYFPVKNWREIILTISFIILFFIIDFIIWTKSKKSIWKKIIKELK